LRENRRVRAYRATHIEAGTQDRTYRFPKGSPGSRAGGSKAQQ